ncbi:MAG: 1-phosphofructokinase family hexose kinase [Defluviitaleaceae bacterium]|nr:1-phosphofructokinase family hexose kinase [Defluviitaleaceae bacterium]
MSITVVSLNPCIDWQLTTPAFVYGGMNRVQQVGRYVAGKGINVCLALSNLGHSTLCTGFNYRENGDFITDELDKCGIHHDFVTVEGAVRTNIKLYDASTGEMTEINQSGGQVSREELNAFHKKMSGIKGSLLVLSGSMPPGVPADIYRRLCEAWSGPVILDAEGEALRLALTGDKPPFCIKPNLYELEHSFGVKFSSNDEIVAFCKGLIAAHGVGMICVSMGAEGALLVTANSVYFLPALKLTVGGVQGAGDSLVAGLAMGLSLGAPEGEMLRMAMAAAAASVVREGTLMCTKSGFDMYYEKMPQPLSI